MRARVHACVFCVCACVCAHVFVCYALLKRVPSFCCMQQATLSKKFKVNGIPTLLFLDATDAKLITADGRSIVMDDPDGSRFPWIPLPFSQLIEGKFFDNKGNETSWSDLKNKVIGLYFSAHWVSLRPAHSGFFNF